MPFGTPTAGQREYFLSLRSTTLVDGYPLDVTCSFNSEVLSDDGVGAVFQSLVDLIDSSAGFTIISASRTRQYAENVTPTS